MQLTLEQENIINSVSDNLFVNSSPGSGKSTLLSYIAEKLVNEGNKVLLLTFTNKGAKTIISKCSNINNSYILGGTFHSIAYHFIKSNNISWNICDEGKKKIIIKKVFKCKKDLSKLNELIEYISYNKCSWPKINCDKINRYNLELRKYNLVDFNDMIYDFIDNINSLNIPKTDYLLCDELQDSSASQFEMLKQLANKTKSKIIGVGDIDQSIFAFQNARWQNVKDFISYFNCKVFNMGTNFRSDKLIIKHANNLIINNKERIHKDIISNSKEEGKIEIYECKDYLGEVYKAINICKYNRNKKIAILYRNRSYKNHLEYELKKNKLDYKINDSLELCDRSAVKTILSLFKLISGSGDLYDLEIASKGLKGLGSKTITKIKEECKTEKFEIVFDNHIHSSKKFISLYNLIGYYNLSVGESLDKLLVYIENFLVKSLNYSNDMKKFLTDITKDYKINKIDIQELYNDLGLDQKEDSSDKDSNIILSTVHAAKGSEHDIVMLLWCNQYDPQPNRDYDIEEERRLFYVGVTRAKHELYLTYNTRKPLFIKELKC